MKSFRFTPFKIFTHDQGKFAFALLAVAGATLFSLVNCGHLSHSTFQSGAQSSPTSAEYSGVGKYSPQGTDPESKQSSDKVAKDSAENSTDGEDAELETLPPETAEENDRPDDFASPDEVLKSPDVQKNTRPYANKGPFRLQWPVLLLKVNRGFQTEGRREHLGLDIAGRRGDRIFAAHDGVVVYAGHSFRGYGNMILLEYNQTWATLYGHLNRFRTHMGQEVKAGALIGEMGRTGRATGVHLHFELIKNKDPIDPAPYLKKKGTA